MNQARALLGAGRYAELAAHGQAWVRAGPDNGFAWMVLGIALERLGQMEPALSAMRDSVRCSPDDAAAHYSLANMLKDRGQLEDAVASYRRALSLKNDFAEALTNLGYVLRALGRLNEAATYLRQATIAKPDLALAHNLLGLVQRDQGSLDEAMVSYRTATRLAPALAEAHFNLGVAHQDRAEFVDAIASYRLALGHKPGYVEAWFNLGLALKETRAYAEACDAFRAALRCDPRHLRALNAWGLTLAEAGRCDEAAQCFRSALAMEPSSADTYMNLGTVATQLGRPDEAEAHYRKAIELSPETSEAYCNLGIALAALGRLVEAEGCYRRSLDLDADRNAEFNLGCLLRDQCRLKEAEESIRAAIARAPTHHGYYHGLLFTLNYDPDRSGEEIFAAYREFEDKLVKPLYVGWRAHDNDRDGERRLRVGYVSGDFCQHVVHRFLEPLMAGHDHERFEIFAYAELRREDAVTARFRTYADHWLPTVGLSDDALAERIRADGIDILVDLAGHTSGNRLLVFARKPAPVSVSWLGYGYTTGVSAIDYLLTDEASAPAGSEHLFAERPWRLATPGYVYRPAAGMGEVSGLPAAERGYVTLGTLTRGVRINHRVVRVWSEILKQLPGARLVIDSGHFKEPGTQEVLAGRFAAHGIDRERLAIGCHSPPWDVLRGMDIGLDCFPHNSGTTLFESLYMGVPFVTLAGRPSVGRLGSSILTGLGHPEWIAASEAEYVAKVVALAGDLPRLAAIRAGLRPAMQASALMDEAGFTRRVEAAYREMFKRWAETDER